MGIDSSLTGKAISAVPLDKIIGQPIELYQDALISAKQKVELLKQEMYYEKDGKQKNIYVETQQHTTQADGSITEKTLMMKVPRILYDNDGEGWEQVGGGQDVEFRMEINSSFSQEDEKAGAGGFEGEGKVGYGPVSVKVKVHGSFSASSKSSSASSIKSVWDIKQNVKPKENTTTQSYILDKMLGFCEPVVIGEKTISVDELKKSDQPSEGKDKTDKKK